MPTASTFVIAQTVSNTYPYRYRFLGPCLSNRYEFAEYAVTYADQSRARRYCPPGWYPMNWNDIPQDQRFDPGTYGGFDADDVYRTNCDPREDD